MKMKGFDKNLCCRGMQFEVGKIYDTGAADDKISLCSDTVFHYCDSIRKVHSHYSCNPVAQNRFCEIEVLGAEVTDGEICGSNRIQIVREIIGDELNILIGLTNGNTGLFNTGHRNAGDRNTGFFNSCNGSNGVFCNQEDKNIRIFNMPSGMSLSEFRQSKYYDALYSSDFPLTYWDEETQQTTSRSYKEACAIWWENMSQEDKAIVQSMPNFDAGVFFDITGIRAEESGEEQKNDN